MAVTVLVAVRFADGNAELSLRLPAPCRRSASLRGNKSLEPNGTACTRAEARPQPRAIGSARQ